MTVSSKRSWIFPENLNTIEYIQNLFSPNSLKFTETFRLKQKLDFYTKIIRFWKVLDQT